MPTPLGRVGTARVRSPCPLASFARAGRVGTASRPIEVGAAPRAALGTSRGHRPRVGARLCLALLILEGRGEAMPLPACNRKGKPGTGKRVPLLILKSAIRTPYSVFFVCTFPQASGRFARLHFCLPRVPSLTSYFFFFSLTPLRRPFLPMPKGAILPCWTFWKRLFEFVTPRQ
jgi:hypothetical protein